ncbi:Restriction modification system DNA specificity domain [Nitrosococcus oceani ATCC 19707]|uniref:Restriction modification system DNA specificity domain n=2 Tax=Nitrosococcus oceani TaxID=1229 RepID=Q3JDX6_NITOC|nr:Restriction modification system DNA specificity domain [Nitrosococcus oceani ATCC 19707]
MSKAMKNDKQMRVPKLRFPEFRDAGEWEKVALSTQVELLSGLHLSPDGYTDTGDIPYFTGPSDYTNDLALVSKWTTRSANVGRAGDTLITVKGSGVGELLNLELDEVAMGRQLMAVRARTAHGEFIFHFLITQRLRLIALASGNLIPGLSRGDILSLKVPVPSHEEQQKIADCLSSLDALIAAQTEKLDALKTHKKGLMQQLFPRAGETVPRLRFPKFRDGGRWTSKKMSDVYRFLSTNTYSRDKLNYEKGEVKNIHYGDIHTKFSTLFDVTQEYVPYINRTESLERIKDDSYCLEGDIVFADASEDVEDVGKSIEIVNTGNEKILSGLHTLLARQKNNDLVIGFGGYLFKSGLIREQIKRESQGAKVLGISSGRLSKIKVCFPYEKREQQKIAHCLSSLDALIAAQAEKIDALKTHKKGLMQQLFPSLEEVHA